MITLKNKQKIGELMDAIMLLKNSEEAEAFFRDLLTGNELIEFGNRWKAARMLWNKESYVDIAKETGLSSTTIARVSKWLNGGKNGYKLILSRMTIDEKHHNPHHKKKGLF
jgi:TrpR-related protein YerC/YecD